MFAPPADESTWYKLESVDLANAPFGEESDKMGVVVRWRPPDMTLSVTADDLRRVQERVKASKWRRHHSAKAWVGHVVADILGLDVNHKIDCNRISQLLDGWIGNGSLIVVKEPDARRVLREFVQVGVERIAPSAP